MQEKGRVAMIKSGCVFCAVALAFGAWAQESFKAGEGVANSHSSNVSFVTRGGGNDYGYGAGSQYFTPLGLTLIAWDIPNSISVVKGLRLNLGFGRFERTYGFDLGLFSRSGDFVGVAGNLVGNFSERDAEGIQIGAVNGAEADVRGVQIGVVNWADRLCGLQIGLLNINRAGIVFPILNVGW